MVSIDEARIRLDDAAAAFDRARRAWANASQTRAFEAAVELDAAERDLLMARAQLLALQAATARASDDEDDAPEAEKAWGGH